MAKFRKGEARETPGMNTASLPDIVFMLLFFFMVITTMKSDNLKVKTVTPSASEVEKLELKTFVHTIYVGPPTDPIKYGTTPRMQLNDELAPIDAIPRFIAQVRDEAREGTQDVLVTSLKADKDKVKMGLIIDIKQELRKMGQLNLNYSAKKGKKLAE